MQDSILKWGYFVNSSTKPSLDRPISMFCGKLMHIPATHKI